MCTSKPVNMKQSSASDQDWHYPLVCVSAVSIAYILIASDEIAVSQKPLTWSPGDTV